MTALFERIKSGVPGKTKRPIPAVSVPYASKAGNGALPLVIDSPYASITVEALTKEVGLLPAGCVIIGACEDRVHFYMDLNDPRPGSVLIAARRGGGQARLLHSILASAVLLNTHRHLRYALLTASPEQFGGILQQPHCYRVVSAGSPALGQALGQAITQLADYAEKRLEQKSTDSVMILAIDGLDAVTASIDDQAYNDLAWLIRHGPALRIWPFVTLDADRASLVGTEWIELFGTLLLGNMDAKQAGYFKGDAAVTSRLTPGKQFCVWFDQEWLNFWAPAPDQFNQ